MNYFISDIHFGSVNSWDKRTLEHDQILITKWNKVIHNNDDIWILGDVGRGGTNDAIIYTAQCLATLKGRKHLIIGNHDKDLIKDWRIQSQFIEMVDRKALHINEGGKSYRLILDHYPILMWDSQHKGTILLYGHTHNSTEDNIYQCALAQLNAYFESERAEGRTDCPEAIAINVGAMKSYIDYYPQTITQLLKGRN